MSALTDFIDRVIQRFPPSFRWDDAQKNSWTEDMVRELRGFTDDVLKRAIRDIVRTRGMTTEERRTPTVAECIQYCIAAKKAIFAEGQESILAFSPQARPVDPFLKDWREDDFANDLALNRKDPLCVQAAKEGWIGTMHSFVRKHRRMPSSTEQTAYRKSKNAPEQIVTEIEWCKREAKDFDEAYAKCVGGGWHFAQRLTTQVGDVMLERRTDLIDYVLHGVDFRKKSARAVEVVK